MDNINGEMDQNMRDKSKITSDTGKGFIKLLTISTFIMGNGNMEKEMEREN